MPVGPRPEPPVDSVRVAISGKIFTHLYINVFWLQLTRSGAATVNDLNTVVDAMLASYNTRLVSKLGQEVTGGEADASWITSAGNELNTVRNLTFTPGGNPAVPDASACYVMSSTISSRYRGGHPRNYLPGPQSGHVINGSTVVAAQLAVMVAAAAGFRNDVDALTAGAITAVQLGTVSFVTGGAWRTPPVFRPYTGSTVRSTIGSQRRRIKS
jgi:hypothetical protein